ncbi:uncharacterized protein LOC132976219 [Labrus mixtus]|uniref:uncharacterized protein LOC132976219 n=1 Tax=Labrus mixtus TaxID=508554 RepID=UPI0029BFB3E4|nr:uncharacterized protein LOC132976219 [Labrus mixtus]
MNRLTMGLKSRVGVRNTFVLLILGNIATVISLYGQSLDCTNDFEEFLFCSFGGENCTEYNMTLKWDKWYGEKGCIFRQCHVGQCCCSVQMNYFVINNKHTATVWKNGKSIETKTINVTDSIKPKTPTIISVDESNGNYQVMWLTNTDQESILTKSLTAEVTYYERGCTDKVSVKVNQTADGGRNYYEIQGRLLNSSTTYVVSVKSFIDWSGKYSDSSNEWEFTTSVSSSTLFLAIIFGLSVAAVLISGVIYGCYVKIKNKWLDIVAKFPNPKLLDVHSSKQEVLKPVRPIISSVCVEPFSDDSKPWLKDSLKDFSSGSNQQSSGISTGSSYLSYANTEPADIIAEVQEALRKTFANICPILPLTTSLLTDSNKNSGLLCDPHSPCDVKAEDMSSGSSAFLNITYSLLIPHCPAQIKTDITDVQTQNEMLCESAYCPSEGVTVISYQEAPACPLISLTSEVSSLLPTDMSYQPCNADSGGFSYAEDSGSSAFSSGRDTAASCDPGSRVKAACEILENENPEQVTVCDENPCYNSMPAGSQSFPPVDCDYQPFQNLVEQPCILLSEKRSDEKEEHLAKQPQEAFITMPQTLLNPVVAGPTSNGRCLSELQRPFLSLSSADQFTPVITDSGYHCV